MTRRIKWFTVQVVHSDRAPFALAEELERGGIFISVGGRLCQPGFSVHLKSKPLAEAYIQALSKRRKKMDPDFEARVCDASSENEKVRESIAKDSQIVAERLARWGVKVGC